MKKILLSLFALIVLVVGGFFAYIKFKPGPPAQVLKTELGEISLPEGFNPTVTESYTHNYGGTTYSTDYEGVGENAGVRFHLNLNDNSEEDQMDGQLDNILIHDFKEIRMSEVEYHAETPDSIDFQGRKALRYFYTIKDEPYDEEEGKKNPRSAYKKGEAIAFFCSGKTVIMYFETFEKHWDANLENWKAIKEGMKLKCN